MTRADKVAMRAFSWMAQHPRWVLLLALLSLLGSLALATRLAKDTTADAFIDPANPALLYRQRVESDFGISDPLVIGVFGTTAQGASDPGLLQYVRQATEALRATINVDPQRVRSMATESFIVGTDTGLELHPFVDTEATAKPDGASSLERLAAALETSPLHRGSLVARDLSGTVIVAELIHPKSASETYAAAVEWVARHPAPRGVQVYVAGEGAITGSLSTYIDNDARRLVPLALIVIAAVLFAAFRRWQGVLWPLCIVVCTVLGTLGLMAVSGVAYYSITSGMVVALVGMAVADSLHILDDYGRRAASDRSLSAAAAITATMSDLWRPVTLTSFTTIAGFLALWPSNSMPPIRWFGVFGAIGVALAWLFTMTLLPALLAISPAWRQHKRTAQLDRAPASVLRLGAWVLQRPKTTIVLGLLACAIGVAGLLQVTVDYSRIDNFGETSDLHRADRRINAAFDGTYHLDVLVESGRDDGILDPAVLQSIASLQAAAEALPGVGGTISIVDYILQMNRAVNEGRREAAVIPPTIDEVAQLFLLYTTAGDPTDFEQHIDAARRDALVRIRISSPKWSDHARIVGAMEQHLARHFSGGTVRASLTGRVMVDHVWMQGIRDGHFVSVAVSLLAVGLMCVLLFRLLWLGLACLLPICAGTLGVYAVMGFGGIWLGVATSMFASVAIGLGVDFAIHVIDRYRRNPSGSPRRRLEAVYQATGRPLLFNALAVALGFGVVAISQVPPVRQFGALVAIGILAACLASLTMLPALLAVLTSETDAHAHGDGERAVAPATAARSLTSAAVLFLLLSSAAPARAVETAPNDPAAAAIMLRVADRPDARSIEQIVRIESTDRRGVQRVEETRVFRERTEIIKRTAIFYLEPSTVRGTAFLIHDPRAADAPDDQWLYLPALRKVRRIPATDRGNAFLGTDLSYDEVKNDSRVTPRDWHFVSVRQDAVGGVACQRVEGHPSSNAVAAELGYSRAAWCVDPNTWLPLRAEYWDLNGNPTKTVQLEDIRNFNGIWIAMRVVARNHKSGHSTLLRIRDVAVDRAVPADLFSVQRLSRGL